MRLTHAALLSTFIALSACKREPPAPTQDAGPQAPPVDAGTQPSEPDAGPGEVRLPEHPLLKLSGCGDCPDAGGPASCELCRKGWRCVQSLVDPSWAAIEELDGFTIYRREPCTDCAQVRWAAAARVQVVEETQENPARLEDLPEGTPIDLERHMAPFDGDCPPAAAELDEALADYFSEDGRASLKVVATRHKGPYARIDVSIDGHRGFVLLRLETEACRGWHVEAFGFPGCPWTHPAFFPAELQTAP